jgi:hypothetical protein
LDQSNTSQKGCGDEASDIPDNTAPHGDDQGFTIRARPAQRSAETLRGVEILRSLGVVEQMHGAVVGETESTTHVFPQRTPDSWR